MSLVEFERRVNALTQMRVADVASPILSKDDRHHLFKVLRAEPGEERQLLGEVLRPAVDLVEGFVRSFKVR